MNRRLDGGEDVLSDATFLTPTVSWFVWDRNARPEANCVRLFLFVHTKRVDGVAQHDAILARRKLFVGGEFVRRGLIF